MAKVIVTAADMYDALLEGLRKEKTRTLYPDEAQLLLNESQLEVVKNRYFELERTQKRIDDLRTLKAKPEIILPNATEGFDLPYDETATDGLFGYLFMLNVAVKLQYVDNECYTTGTESDFIKAKVMKSDKELEISRDPYNKPTDDRPYYDIYGNEVTVITNSPSIPVSIRIVYLRYPRAIDLESNPQVDCELPIHLRKEIVDVAIRAALERFKDPRFQTNAIERNQTIL